MFEVLFEPSQEFVNNLSPTIQWLGIMLIATIPFIESYFGSIIGIIAGVNPMIAIPAAIIGNIVSMLAFVFLASSVRKAFKGNVEEKPESKRRQKLRAAFDRYGVAAVSLIGPTIIASQISSTAMISFGADRNRVIIWQIISIVMWGIMFGALAHFGLEQLKRS